MMAPQRIARSYLVVGKTLEGWLAAAYLARLLGPLDVTVNICGSSQDQPPPPAVATLPGFVDLLRDISVDELDLLRFCGGTIRLGTRYVNGEREFVHAFGSFPPPVDGVPFYQHWLGLRGHEPRLPALDAHDFACRAARDDRIGQLEQPRDGFRTQPAMHLDGEKLQEFFRRCALHYKTREIAPDVGGDGLMGGAEADILVDARGDIGAAADDIAPAGGGLVMPAQGDSFGAIEWREAEAIEPGALSHAEFGSVGGQPGWTLSLPLQARAWTARCAPVEAGDTANGWLAEPWRRNVVAIGRSACRLSPLEAPLMRVVEAGLTTLRALAPLAGESSISRDEYNRRMREVFTGLDEFQGLHRCLAGFKGGEPADWSVATEPLRYKLEQFANNGRIVTSDGESFDEHSYALSYIGHGLLPASVNPMARQRTVDEVATILRRHRETVEAALGKVPTQRELAAHLRQATSAGQ